MVELTGVTGPAEEGSDGKYSDSGSEYEEGVRQIEGRGESGGVIGSSGVDGRLGNKMGLALRERSKGNRGLELVPMRDLICCRAQLVGAKEPSKSSTSVASGAARSALGTIVELMVDSESDERRFLGPRIQESDADIALVRLWLTPWIADIVCVVEEHLVRV